MQQEARCDLAKITRIGMRVSPGVLLFKYSTPICNDRYRLSVLPEALSRVGANRPLQRVQTEAAQQGRGDGGPAAGSAAGAAVEHCRGRSSGRKRGVAAIRAGKRAGTRIDQPASCDLRINPGQKANTDTGRGPC